VNRDEEPFERPRATDEAAHSGDRVADNIAALKALFPEIVTDGRIDFEVLRQLLGDQVEVGEERYGLNWKGKAAARAFALTPSLGTLRPARADSVDWDTTQNILIEGDNLEVLKLLRRSYAGKVKLIYIDPPYNTGKDFVYPDNYTDNLGNYERLTGQRGADGVALTTNREASGRFHTDWLNMMYPRLMLAKELLRDDGVIAISCDDGELATLRVMASDVLGPESFEAQIIWRKRSTPPNDKRIGANHDYIILCTARGSDSGINLRARSEEQFERYQNPDNHPKGAWAPGDLMANVKGGRYVESLYFAVENPETGQQHFPGDRGNWRFSKSTIDNLIVRGEISFGTDGKGRPKLKRFLCDVKEGVTYPTIWDFVPLNTDGSSEMFDVFGEATVFESPKPSGLIKEIVQLGCRKSDLILDFFAGSGTTGHAVMAQNAADGGNRRYILVQLPEPLDPANASQKTAADFCDRLGKPRTIAELTKERLRRAGKKLKAESGAPGPRLEGRGRQARGDELDVGFRVYKLATSNLRPWQPDAGNLEQQLLDGVDNILPGRSEEDLLTELLLKTGIDLTLPTQTRIIAGKAVHALGGGTLIVCLAKDVADADAEALALGIADWRAALDPPAATAFWFRDAGFASAAAKANVVAILKQRIAPTAITRIAAV
jgi:adenine-specific DNA-methyltransferase